MKKMIFTLALVCGLTTMVSAQTGKIWTGGSVGIMSSDEKDGPTLTNYNIVPEVGYMLYDNLGIGIKLGYFHKEDLAEGKKQKKDGFKINPFARYSFLRGNIGGLFVDGGVGYTYSKNKLFDTKSHELEVGFRPGVAINVADNVSLTGQYGFLGYIYEKDGGKKTNTYGFDFDLSQVRLGINIIF
ncbi:porin family protein [Dysgonomonas sp. 216]|uniref:outer membrane beta-barrel protein n=1 Tax=Dysgonomonas sp. 216 TaxID=2302934 RepID=UPI0013D80404|nr:outer membrane beta-barrel protein [Dysgonomonas sp. 216]NDW18176.1 porin family protein [Dysgonomonas sp. 216]